MMEGWTIWALNIISVTLAGVIAAILIILLITDLEKWLMERRERK
jgi:protein-S-isoprenylcysteine O-methyltransferase Ste14